MAILREWRAEIRRALRDEYVEYVTATGLAAYRATPRQPRRLHRGTRSGCRAQRDRHAELVEPTPRPSARSPARISSALAISPQDERFLLTRPERVAHYDAAVPGP